MNAMRQVHCSPDGYKLIPGYMKNLEMQYVLSH